MSVAATSTALIKTIVPTKPAKNDVQHRAQHALKESCYSEIRRASCSCHEGVAIDRRRSPGQLASLYLSSRLAPRSAEPDVRSSAEETFEDGDASNTYSSKHPLTKAALVHLGEVKPGYVRFDELVAGARARLATGEADIAPTDALQRDRDELARSLLLLQGG